MIFLAGLTILKKVMCLGIVGGCEVDPVVALHLNRAFLISVNNKKDFSFWFDNSKKGEMSVQIEWMWG